MAGLSNRSSQNISIHALREEGDSAPRKRALVKWDFYPRPPRGGRRDVMASYKPRAKISIHALREEGDAFRPTC